MEREPLRTGLNDSAIVGLLSSLALLDGPAARPSFVPGIGRWLGWADAIPLSTALHSPPHGAAASARRDASAPQCEREFERVRAALVQSIEADVSAGRWQVAAKADKLDFRTCRQRYVALQQMMQAAIEPLRAQLRAAVARRSPAMHRLASLDAALDKVLAARELDLLALMPTLLESHFERLRHAANEPSSADWQAVFRKDMQRLLRAELELRLQPVLGLIGALRSQPQGSS
jgi:hypothetical protein